MLDYEQRAHRVNAFASEGDWLAALEQGRYALLELLNEIDNRVRFDFLFRPLADLIVESRSQLLIRITAGLVNIVAPCELVSPHFTNWLDAFVVIRTLFGAMDVVADTAGWFVFDIEDGSSAGRYPRIAFGATDDRALLVVDSYWVKYHGYEALRCQIKAAERPWIDREDKVFWRGGTTGLRSFTPMSTPVEDWSWLQRLQLCDVVAQSSYRNRLDVGISHFAQVPEEYLVEEIRRAGFVRERCEKLRFLDYRFIVDVDGNANAWDGLFGAMLMGACILKVQSRAGWREWYYARLIPYHHYIPLRVDMQDLDEKLRWMDCNQDKCEEIGRNASRLAWAMRYQDEIRQSCVDISCFMQNENVMVNYKDLK